MTRTVSSRIAEITRNAVALVNATGAEFDADDVYAHIGDVNAILPFPEEGWSHTVQLDTHALRDLYCALRAELGGHSSDQRVIVMQNAWYKAEGRKALDLNGKSAGIAWIFALITAARWNRADLASLPPYACEFTTAADAYYDAQ